MSARKRRDAGNTYILDSCYVLNYMAVKNTLIPLWLMTSSDGQSAIFQRMELDSPITIRPPLSDSIILRIESDMTMRPW